MSSPSRSSEGGWLSRVFSGILEIIGLDGPREKPSPSDSDSSSNIPRRNDSSLSDVEDFSSLPLTANPRDMVNSDSQSDFTSRKIRRKHRKSKSSESLLGHRHVQPYVVLDHDTFAGICLKFDMAASQFFVLNPQKHSVGGRVLLVPGEEITVLDRNRKKNSPGQEDRYFQSENVDIERRFLDVSDVAGSRISSRSVSSSGSEAESDSDVGRNASISPLPQRSKSLFPEDLRDSPSVPEQRHPCDGTSVTSVRLPLNEEILCSGMECVTSESRDAVIPVDFLSNSGISSSASEPIHSRDQSQVEMNVSSLASSQSSSVPDIVPSKKSVDYPPMFGLRDEHDDSSLSMCSPNQLALLIDSFPHNNRRLDWFLVYSSSVHGISLQTLFRRWELLSENLPGHRNSPPSVFLIETTHGQILGGYANDAWEKQPTFFGRGTSFVFSFTPELTVYRWSKKNHNFQHCGDDHIAMGGGGAGSSWWIDQSLTYGTTAQCDTFDSSCLINPHESSESFKILRIELWALVRGGAKIRLSNSPPPPRGSRSSRGASSSSKSSSSTDRRR